MTKITKNKRQPSYRRLCKQRELAKLKRNQRILNTIPVKTRKLRKKTKTNSTKNLVKKRRTAFKHAKNQILNLCF